MYELINKVKELNPLVLHYTNNVTITDCANMTLAIGASPLMSFSYEEVEDMVPGLRGVVEQRAVRVADDLFKVFVVKACAGDKAVEVVDVGFFVLAVVELYRALADGGLESIVGVGQFRL